MEKICMNEELIHYNLAGKWNDYIGVQKEVLNVLRKENCIYKNYCEKEDCSQLVLDT